MRRSAVSSVYGPSQVFMANTIRKCLCAEGEQPRFPRVSRWDSKELRVVGCVSIAKSHEHTAGEIPHLISSGAVGMHPVCWMMFPQHLQHIRWVTGDHRVLEKVASRRRETPQLCLECTDRQGPPQPTPLCTRLSRVLVARRPLHASPSRPRDGCTRLSTLVLKNATGCLRQTFTLSCFQTCHQTNRKVLWVQKDRPHRDRTPTACVAGRLSAFLQPRQRLPTLIVCIDDRLHQVVVSQETRLFRSTRARSDTNEQSAKAMTEDGGWWRRRAQPCDTVQLSMWAGVKSLHAELRVLLTFRSGLRNCPIAAGTDLTAWTSLPRWLPPRGRYLRLEVDGDSALILIGQT